MTLNIHCPSPLRFFFTSYCTDVFKTPTWDRIRGVTHFPFYLSPPFFFPSRPWYHRQKTQFQTLAFSRAFTVKCKQIVLIIFRGVTHTRTIVQEYSDVCFQEDLGAIAVAFKISIYMFCYSSAKVYYWAKKLHWISSEYRTFTVVGKTISPKGRIKKSVWCLIFQFCTFYICEIYTLWCRIFHSPHLQSHNVIGINRQRVSVLKTSIR